MESFIDPETLEGMPTGKVVFTHADREKLVAIHKAVTELQELIKQVEPFLDSFMGSGGAPKSPMNMILGSLMGGGR